MFEAVVTELYWVTAFFNNETPISTVTPFKFSTNSGQCTTKTVYEKRYVDSTYFVDLNVAYFVDRLL